MILTKEKREKLIDLIEKSIPIMKAQSNLPYSNSELVNHIEIYELALEALKADSVGSIQWSTGYQMGLVPEINNGVELPQGTKLYTALPVTEFKIVDKKDRMNPVHCTAEIYLQGKIDGWNNCLEEIKKLNNIEG